MYDLISANQKTYGDILYPVKEHLTYKVKIQFPTSFKIKIFLKINHNLGLPWACDSLHDSRGKPALEGLRALMASSKGLYLGWVSGQP